MKNSKRIALVLFAAVSVAAAGFATLSGDSGGPAGVAPVSSTFTYQGRLLSSGEPFDGVADLTFKLFDSPEGPNQIADTLVANQFPIDEGLFTIDLDFGSKAFDGNERWLEVSVDRETLDPRQQVTAAPYAMFSLQAGLLNNLPSSSFLRSDLPDVVDSFHIAAEAIGADELQLDSVGSSHILDGSVTASDLSANSVGSKQIQASSVTRSHLGGSSVGSSQVQDESLTAADLAGNSVGSSEIADGAVGNNELATNAVMRSHMADNSVGSAEVQDNSLTASDLAADSVGSSEILSSAVGSSELANAQASLNKVSGSVMTSSSGNIGIGTSNPGAKLDVNGLGAFNQININGSGAETLYVAGSGAITDNLHVDGTIRSRGIIRKDNSAGSQRVSLNITTADAGFVGSRGPNGINNVVVSHLFNFPNNGFVEVEDSGGTQQAGMYVNADGDGIVFGDTKNFRVQNPNQEGTEIWYASLEGPEAAAYIRGTGHLVNGFAVITFPEHFLAVASSQGMTVQLTPLSADSKGLAAVEKSLEGVVVQELSSGVGTYDFDYSVTAIRHGHEDYQVIRPALEGRPAPALDVADTENEEVTP